MICRDWAQWIKTCFAQGCCPEATSSIMKESGFTEATIQEAMSAHWNNDSLPATEFCGSYIDRAIQTYNDITIEYLNLEPVVAVFHNLLTPEECESIKELGTGMRRATVVGDQDRVVSESRTNDLMSLQYAQCPAVKKLETQLSELSRIPVQQGEMLQMLRYSPGQFYLPHQDYFHGDSPVTRLAEKGQRIATVVTYLNTPEAGGETYFPRLDIRVKPQMGTAVYFEYTDSSGNITDQCLHSSEPVVSGEKWVVTKWFRNKPYMSAEDMQRFTSGE